MDIRDYLSQLELNERISVVFIHGYNASFRYAAIRAAQIGFDLKIPGAMAFFSWPSRATALGYSADEASIQASEDEISNFLINFARKTGSERIHIIAHSMGNRGLLRAIQRITHGVEADFGVKFGQIILAAPDLDVDVFRGLARLYPAISERTTLYASAKDRAVALSHVLHGYDRAGFIPPVTIVPGIDTVEVTNIDLSLLGHSYIAEAEAVLYDMHELIFHNASPDNRTRLCRVPAVPTEEPPYWIINA
jgi:esterase/lipase superfamily enzyme